MSSAMDAMDAMVRVQLERMRVLLRDLAAIRIREISPDAVVTAEVDGSGALVDLELSGAISRLTPAEFTRMLLDVTSVAARKAFAVRAELINDFNASENATPGAKREHDIE